VVARKGVTTGISAADRAATVRLLASPQTHPYDLVRPGHIFPVRARVGGTLARAGHTEAAMDLARYYTSGEVQDDVPPGSNVPTGFYLAPGARKSVKVTAPLDIFIPMLPDMYVTPLIVNWAPLTRLIHPEYQNILFGKQKPEDGMKKIAAEADRLISGK